MPEERRALHFLARDVFRNTSFLHAFPRTHNRHTPLTARFENPLSATDIVKSDYWLCHVGLSVRIEKLGCHWTDFYEI
jgi:hypothetical protein